MGTLLWKVASIVLISLVLELCFSLVFNFFLFFWGYFLFTCFDVNCERANIKLPHTRPRHVSTTNGMLSEQKRLVFDCEIASSIPRTITYPKGTWKWTTYPFSRTFCSIFTYPM